MPENVKNSAVESTDSIKESKNKFEKTFDEVQKDQENSVNKQKLLEKKQSYSDVMDSFDEVNKLEEGKEKKVLLKFLGEATTKLDVNDSRGAKEILSFVNDKVLDLTIDKVDLGNLEKKEAMLNSKDSFDNDIKISNIQKKQETPDVGISGDGIDNSNVTKDDIGNNDGI